MSETTATHNHPPEVTKGGSAEEFDPRTLVRPVKALLHYYIIGAAATLIGFPFVFLPLFFKYETMRYRFDDKGVSKAWGLLFRREIYLTYRRIQDIHVTRNFIQRWLGLATVSIQTASGTAGAELTVEGIEYPEQLRDYLYAQMRGVRDGTATEESGIGDESATAAAASTQIETAGDDEALALLHEIRDEIKALRASRTSTVTSRPEPVPDSDEFS